MLMAYLDDSSDPKRERFCGAGGVFTIDRRWKRFEITWGKATEELRFPFRSTDCENGYGQFTGWPKPKRDSLMARLCGIIKEYDLGAFGSAVSVPEYRRIFPLAGEHDPYLLCLGMCFA